MSHYKLSICITHYERGHSVDQGIHRLVYKSPQLELMLSLNTCPCLLLNVYLLV
jgi:hypothetical protein